MSKLLEVLIKGHKHNLNKDYLKSRNLHITHMKRAIIQSAMKQRLSRRNQILYTGNIRNLLTWLTWRIWSVNPAWRCHPSGCPSSKKRLKGYRKIGIYSRYMDKSPASVLFSTLFCSNKFSHTHTPLFSSFLILLKLYYLKYFNVGALSVLHIHI
jgi:hypothetical protein